MSASQPFEVVYAPQVKIHLRFTERKYHSLIRNVIEDQLQFEPVVETRNRKPLKRPAEFGADWEIRFGPNNRFRVFYEVNEVRREVNVLAVGVKRGNKLFIGGEEVEL